MFLAIAIAAAGCGGASTAGPASSPAPAGAAPASTETQIEQRRDAACTQLGPKITACAVTDARASFAAGKIDQRQLERDTAPAVQAKNTEEFERACKNHPYSSRQVRVLEVCFREETQCAPLLECLGHLSDAPPAH